MSVPQKGDVPVESRDDLVRFLEAGCKPPDRWRIGTEHEKFGYRVQDRRPLPYDGDCSVNALLKGIAERFGWEPLLEAGRVVGLSRGEATISLEPGGQIELSGAPLATLHETCDEANLHLAEVREVASAVGAGFLGMGLAPEWHLRDMPSMPKGRYDIMRSYMPRVGGRGLEMMHCTCTIQVNLDYASEADMVRKFRAGVLLQPVATALFASSPFRHGSPNGVQSGRAHVWEDVDPARSGAPMLALRDGFGFESWVDHVLDVPMYFVHRNGRHIDASGQSFRAFLEGRLPALPGERPRLADWGDHLTTVFPDVRVKQFIEMRGADGGPWRRICALPALWVGLLYDSAALDAALDLAGDWPQEEFLRFRRDAFRVGLDARIAGRDMRSIASEILEIARGGLARRRRAGLVDVDETSHLNDLLSVVDRGETAASEMLRLWRTEWKGELAPLYEIYGF